MEVSGINMMPIILAPVDSSYGMSHQDMINEVRDQCRNNTVDSKITRWINMAIITLSSKFIFPHLHTLSSFETIANTRNYSLPVDLLWAKGFWVPSEKRMLLPADTRTLALYNAGFLSETGQVTNYILNGRSIDLYKVPSANGLTITYAYQRRPLTLVSLLDNCDFPYEWHPLIVQFALIRAFKYEKNMEDARDAYLEYKDMLAELKKTLHTRPDWHYVMNEPKENNPNSSPTFPSNYPRIRR